MYKLETARYTTGNIFTYLGVSYSFFKPQNSDVVSWYNPPTGILFFKDAEAVFECNAEKYNISGNSLVFLPANCFCRVTLKKEFSACYILTFFYDLVCGKSLQYKKLLERFTCAVKNSSVASLNDEQTAEFEELFSAATHPPVDFSDETINIRTLSLSCQCFESCSPVPGICNEHLTYEFNEITKYIYSHLHFNLNLEIISDHFHYDKNYFCRRFKKDTNFTFSQFLTICRIVSSVEYLYNGYSIDETSKFCGYKNSRAYVRAFTEVFRIPPKDFIYNIKHYAFSSRLY